MLGRCCCFALDSLIKLASSHLTDAARLHLSSGDESFNAHGTGWLQLLVGTAQAAWKAPVAMWITAPIGACVTETQC